MSSKKSYEDKESYFTGISFDDYKDHKTRRWFDKHSDLFTSGGRVLFIGPNRCYNLFHTAEQFPDCNFLGVDINKEAVSVGVDVLSGVENADVICGNFLDDEIFELLDGQVFDLIIYNQVHEHIYEDDSVRAVKTLHHFLRDGGFLFVGVPLADGDEHDMAVQERAYDPAHVRFFYGCDSLVDEFVDFFDLIECYVDVGDDRPRPEKSIVAVFEKKS